MGVVEVTVMRKPWEPIMWDTYGPVSVAWRWTKKARLRVLSNAAADYLPKQWQAPIARAAREVSGLGDRAQVYADLLERYAGAVAADMNEAEIRARAVVLAGFAQQADFAGRGDAVAAFEALENWIEAKGGYVNPAAEYTLEGLAKRASCPLWWRRQLRRAVAQCYEKGSYELGAIGANAGAWYCSDGAVKRRIAQVRANEQAMRAAVIERGDGQCMTVWDAAQTSVSNKAIRRGELMTRIKGAEQWADASGLVGLFTTNTCPSRFHAQRKGGGSNPKYDKSTPADAQKWLSLQWARLRAKWGREGLHVMGYRVAEPHHDGCPHWHMLIWCKPSDAQRVRDTMTTQWLRDDGDEPGAAEYRVNIKAMVPGQAAGYVAKYIAKNIDDAHVDDGHTDNEAPGLTVGPDLLGDMEVKPCQRVEAWASTWRIRQFAAIGQPPVTVWRELRRVTLQQAATGSDELIHAWKAVHREGERLACWKKYMQAQGGGMLARDAYRLCVAHVERDRVGRYGAVRERWACGVRDRARGLVPSHLHPCDVTPTKRERWGSEGFAARSAPPPWTRFNNCTHTRKARYENLDQAASLIAAGVLDHTWPDAEPCRYAYQDAPPW